ncbi:hypothetical protein GOP47_0028632 [Adiantum capillus-veneris]|nr:hypothetical protein GOP47_0028632 [Adiantum capillus-veneris]
MEMRGEGVEGGGDGALPSKGGGLSRDNDYSRGLGVMDRDEDRSRMDRGGETRWWHAEGHRG